MFNWINVVTVLTVVYDDIVLTMFEVIFRPMILLQAKHILYRKISLTLATHSSS